MENLRLDVTLAVSSEIILVPLMVSTLSENKFRLAKKKSTFRVYLFASRPLQLDCKDKMRNWLHCTARSHFWYGMTAFEMQLTLRGFIVVVKRGNTTQIGWKKQNSKCKTMNTGYLQNMCIHCICSQQWGDQGRAIGVCVCVGLELVVADWRYEYFKIINEQIDVELV